MTLAEYYMRVTSLFLLILVCGAVSSDAQIPAGERVNLLRYVRASYAGLKINLTQAADRMPEADYGFRPSAMPEVRTYGQVLAHVAAAQFGICASINGVPDPTAGRDLEQELKTKTDVVKALADSFAVCDAAIASLTDQNLTAYVKQGPAELVRAAAVIGLLAHNAEMYGVSTVYLRAKNLVPPSTERQVQRQPASTPR
jgi:hypothetical protein